MSATHRRHRIVARLAASLALLVALLIAPSWAAAQAWEDFYKLGNDAYNAGKYSEAVSNYVRAIQAAPVSAQRAYLNAARAYNQLEQFDHAQQFYTWYIEMVPDDSKAAGELKRVIKKTKNKTVTPITTETQAAAVTKLEAALAAGTFGGDSGAATFYDVLVRTGYASPKLLPLQKTLATGLLAEAQTLATPEPGQSAPTLDREGWRSVRTRLQRATGFVDVLVEGPLSLALTATAEGWEQYLAGEYARAAALFTDAVQRDPTLLAAHWGRALSVMFTDTSPELTATFAAIDDAQAAFERAHRAPEPYFPLLRAKALQAVGRTDEAADLLLSL